MNTKKSVALLFISVLGFFSLTACAKAKVPQMANELRFPVDKIEALAISYDEEDIIFYQSEHDELIIREYMTENKKSYYAKVDEKNKNIQIREGNKPLFDAGFIRYVEVTLPKNYHNDLTVTSTSGKIDISDIDMELNEFHIDNTSGTTKIGNIKSCKSYLSSTSGIIELGNMQANVIEIKTTSGIVTCDKLSGDVTYTTTSGDIEVKSASGSGRYEASNSGKLKVVYDSVGGDLFFLNKNDDITLNLPKDLEFRFEAATKNGSVSTNFQQYLTMNDYTTSGVVGDEPTVTIKLDTNNGDISVMR